MIWMIFSHKNKNSDDLVHPCANEMSMLYQLMNIRLMSYVLYVINLIGGSLRFRAA